MQVPLAAHRKPAGGGGGGGGGGQNRPPNVLYVFEYKRNIF